MIYLIGGSPRCGKSILSKKLAKKIDAQFFGCDYLRSIVMAYISKEELNSKFPFVKMYDDIGHNNKVFFENNTAEQILNADLVEARTLWRGIREFVNQKAMLNRDIVIEGVQLLPELVNELRKEKYFRNIKVVYLIKEGENDILAGFAKNIQNDWLMSDTVDEKTLHCAIKMVQVYSLYFKKEAKKYGFSVFNTEGDFEPKLNEVVECLVK